MTKDVRGQIKFLEELDKAEQKRHEEQEREMLMRAAKSRSKTEDPEQAKLKAKVCWSDCCGHQFAQTKIFLFKAKEMQRAEMEELRQRDANLTALQAIGPRKKPKLEEGATTTVTVSCPALVSVFTCFSTPFFCFFLAWCIRHWSGSKREDRHPVEASNQEGQLA